MYQQSIFHFARNFFLTVICFLPLALYAQTPTASFTVDGQSLPTSTLAAFPLFFNCEPAAFVSTSTGTINYYKLEITDPNTNAVIYTSGDQTGQPPTVDLITLLPVHAYGVFKVSLSVSPGTPGLNQDDTFGYLRLSPSPGDVSLTTITVTNIKNTSTMISYIPASVDPLRPDTIGRYATSFSYDSDTGAVAVCSFGLTLSRWVSGNWQFIWQDTSLSVVPCSPHIFLPIASIGAIQQGNIPFFASAANAPAGSIWKLETIVRNNCGETLFPLEYVFMIRDDDQTHMTDIGKTDDIIKLAPVPCNDHLDIRLDLQQSLRITLQFFSIDGRMVREVWRDVQLDKNQNRTSINTEEWPAGIYFYRLFADGELSSGKIVKH